MAFLAELPDEYLEARKKALKAAQGDSNDAEIELLQDALSIADLLLIDLGALTQDQLDAQQVQIEAEREDG